MKRFIIFLILLGLFAMATPLFAHTELITAVPAPGETLTTSPAEIRLTFNEQLQAGSDIFLFSEGFNYIDDLQVEIDRDQLLVALPELAPDDYTVQWNAISGDGHAVNGSYTFRVVSEQPTRINQTALIVAIIITLLAVVIFSLKLFQRRRHSPSTHNDL
jgi:methionine-rich copper-binding protein CopC